MSAPGSGGAAPSQELVRHRTAADYNSLGSSFARGNRLGCAISAFEAGLALDPAAWEIRYNLALALVRARDFKRARDELKRVLADQPGSAKAHNALGLALQGLGEADAASEQFKAAAGIDPHSPFAFYNLAQLLNSQKRYTGAIYYFRQALAASRSSSLSEEARLGLASAYAATDDYANSIRLLRALTAAHSNSAELHFNLGNAYAHNQQFSEAATEYHRVLAIDPANDAAKLSLAKALLSLYDVQHALPYAQEYAKERPGDAEGYEILGEALKDSARYDEACSALHTAVELDPANYRAHYDLGFVLERSRRPQAALREFKEAIRLNPSGFEAMYELGMTLMKQNERAHAERELAQFQTIKNAGEARTRAGVADRQARDDLKRGAIDDAIKEYAEALKLDPGNAKIHYNFSVALLERGDHESEERELESAVRLDPKFATAYNQLGVCYMADGRLADAERELKLAVENDPGYADAENNLGVLYGRKGMSTQAIEWFQRAATDDPRGPQARVNLGLMLAVERKFGDANDEFRKAIAIDPNYADAYRALGMTALKQGKPSVAASDFRKASELGAGRSNREN
ncbi:MAG: tetratricopeptide repeat protein [Terriglobia bacterium]